MWQAAFPRFDNAIVLLSKGTLFSELGLALNHGIVRMMNSWNTKTWSKGLKLGHIRAEDRTAGLRIFELGGICGVEVVM